MKFKIVGGGQGFTNSCHHYSVWYFYGGMRIEESGKGTVWQYRM